MSCWKYFCSKTRFIWACRSTARMSAKNEKMCLQTCPQTILVSILRYFLQPPSAGSLGHVWVPLGDWPPISPFGKRTPGTWFQIWHRSVAKLRAVVQAKSREPQSQLQDQAKMAFILSLGFWVTNLGRELQRTQDPCRGIHVRVPNSFGICMPRPNSCDKILSAIWAVSCDPLGQYRQRRCNKLSFPAVHSPWATTQARVKMKLRSYARPLWKQIGFGQICETDFSFQDHVETNWIEQIPACSPTIFIEWLVVLLLWSPLIVG